ncbi:S1C family serine protease [Jeotgalicoccus sp. ATCC 8456]|uniref:S1C family serine protease n=1 Tax=Jeotgalicoccus sp. ATCC 8456 TaxID=946435 RepID=UPI0018E6391E|nr:trypsin-like peptidase domain-containing protein [Jeotgalicoccus sp. ATCC 8456]QQD85891.1 trypsin-like peptidase domain-containing protein [Jeotgalicoccus sp. ATCC 8456]
MSDERERPIDRDKYRRTARNFTDRKSDDARDKDRYEFSRQREYDREFGGSEEAVTHEEAKDDSVNEESVKIENRMRDSHDTKEKTKGSFGFKSFLIPLIAGILGALLVLGVYALFTSDNEESEVSTDENTAADLDSNQDVSEVKEQLEADNEGKVITDTTAAVQKAKPAVVSVINMQRMESIIPGMTTDSGEAEEAGSGSGVIYKVDGDLAYVVTNHHVVDGAEQVKINLESGDSVDADIVGTDIWTDLAVLSIPADVVESTIEFGDSSDLLVGEPAIAIGSPLGEIFSGSVSQGIISGLDRSVPVDLDGDGSNNWEASVLQTDAAINPGNSGGALIDSNGRLIGINSMKVGIASVEGIGFAIPVNEVQEVTSQLEENGEVIRPFLGITLQDLLNVASSQVYDQLNLPEDVKGGVIVTSVQDGSPASEAGLQQLDVITQLDGEPIKNMVELRQHLYYEKQSGEEMVIDFYRDGQQESLTVTLE